MFAPNYFPTLEGEQWANGTMTFNGYLGSDQWEAIYEAVTPTDLLSILIDTMVLTAGSSSLSGHFSGSFLVYAWNGNRVSGLTSRCFYTHHLVTLTRTAP
jgi:hypothetical protein